MKNCNNIDDYSKTNYCPGPVLDSLPLAMAYVPWQKWTRIYEPEKGFCEGTIFAELNKPYRGKGGRY